jgi:hypothetical protein
MERSFTGGAVVEVENRKRIEILRPDKRRKARKRVRGGWECGWKVLLDSLGEVRYSPN